MKRWMLTLIAALSLLGIVASGVATAGAQESTTLDVNVTSINLVNKGTAAEVTFTIDCSVNFDYVSVYGQILQTSGRTITFSGGGVDTTCVAGETTTATAIFSVENGKLKAGPATVQISAYAYGESGYASDGVFVNMRLR